MVMASHGSPEKQKQRSYYRKLRKESYYKELVHTIREPEKSQAGDPGRQ